MVRGGRSYDTPSNVLLRRCCGHPELLFLENFFYLLASQRLVFKKGLQHRQNAVSEQAENSRDLLWNSAPRPWKMK